MKYSALSRLVKPLFCTAVVWLLGSAGSSSFAAVTCTQFSSSNASFTYAPGSSAANVVQTTVSFSCTRTGSLTPNQVFFGVTSGQNVSNGVNGAAFGSPASFVRYVIFKDASCSQVLNDDPANSGGNRIAIPLTAARDAAQQIDVVFYTCISSAQNVTSFPVGVYTDAPDMNLRYKPGNDPAERTAKLNVSITVKGSCSIANLPSGIRLTYQAFQNTAAFASGQFNAVCTNSLPYTMKVSPISGVVRGLNYRLGLSTDSEGSATSIGPTSLNDVGGELGTKVHFINAVMQAGQAGRVSLEESNQHTLTITY